MVFLLMSIFSFSAFAADRNINNHCKSEWGTDYEMLEYCIKNQEEAKNNLRNKIISPEISQKCKNEWGTNYEMVDYCVKNQEEAKRNLGY